MFLKITGLDYSPFLYTTHTISPHPKYSDLQTRFIERWGKFLVLGFGKGQVSYINKNS